MSEQTTSSSEQEEIHTEQAPQASEAPTQEDNYKDKYLMLLADMENMRKRMTREKLESVKYSLDNIVCDFLIPLDNLENALKYTRGESVSAELKNWAMGFEMILNQFKEALSQHGVNAFDSLNMPFDPQKHQALEMVESEGPADVVIEECVKGYKREERIIRPARVKVSKQSKET
jgi:molecular chaperone GrpE